MGLNSEKNTSTFWKGLFTLSRPFNSTLAGLATVIGILISIGFDAINQYILEMVLAAIVTALIAAGGYVINDYFDVEIDRINQPQRAIPSNQVSLKQAYAYAMFLFLAGFVLSFFIAFLQHTDIILALFTPFLALLGIICLYMYAYYFKRTAGLGNLIITILVCIPLLYGGTITNNYHQTLYPILVASTLMLGREIIKDVEDVEGDLQGSSAGDKNITTLPMVFGVRKTAWLGKSILILFLVFSPIAFLPPYIKIFQSWALFLCITIADILVFISIVNLHGSEEELMTRATKSKRLLKTTLAFGILGLLLASVTPFSQLPF